MPLVFIKPTGTTGTLKPTGDAYRDRLVAAKLHVGYTRGHMSPEDRRQLIEQPFPVVRVEAPVKRHAGTCFSDQNLIKRGYIGVQDVPDDPDYFSQGVYQSLTETEKLERWRRNAKTTSSRIQSCLSRGRVR